MPERGTRRGAETKQSRKNTSGPELIYECVLIRKGGGAATEAVG